MPDTPPTPTPAAAGRPTPAQKALGLLVCVQLVYLLVANGLNVLGSPHLGVVGEPSGLRLLQRPTDVWAETTYQFQGWTQYAPFVAHQSGFACVELRWPPDQGRPPVQLLSEIEPADSNHFFRPIFQFRLAVFESGLTDAYWAWDADTAPARRDEWRAHLARRFVEQRRHYRDYMLWRGHRYQQEHPEAPPAAELVFLVRLYAVSPPGQRPWRWKGPVEVPVTRLRFAGNWETDALPEELYDPFAGTFLPVPPEGWS